VSTAHVSPYGGGALEECDERHLVRERKGDERTERSVCLPALDDAEVFGVDGCYFGGLLLRQALRLPYDPQTQPQTPPGPFDRPLDRRASPDLRTSVRTVGR